MDEITKDDILTTLKVHRALRDRLVEVHRDYSWVGLDESAAAEFEVRYDLDDILRVRFVDLIDPLGAPQRDHIKTLRRRVDDAEDAVRLAGVSLADRLGDHDIRQHLANYNALVDECLRARAELSLCLGADGPTKVVPGG
tara:strand:+ start:305 stop:724 length:420 start_codon:yes stop_codon:yes gene_type:complete